jgi:hypothetical protein
MKLNPETGEAISKEEDRYLLKCRVYDTSQVMDNESMTVKCLARNMETFLQFKDEL